MLRYTNTKFAKLVLVNDALLHDFKLDEFSLAMG